MIALILFLIGCGSTAEAPPEEPAAAVCTVRGTLADGAGNPLVGRTVVGVASRPIDERRSRTVGKETAIANHAGGWALDLECGADLDLHVGGWLWHNAQPRLTVTADLIVPMTLSPKLGARLSVVDATGKAIPSEFESAFDSTRVPIPVEGLELFGFEPASPAGVIHAEGFPPRPWTYERSDVITPRHEGEFDVDVVMGEGAAHWLSLGSSHKQVRGAWCIADGARGEACKVEPSALRCPCSGPVAVAGPGEVGWVAELPQVETTLEPIVGTRCLPGDRARPAGIDGGLVLETSYAPGTCIQVVQDSALEARVDGVWVPAP